MTAKNKHKIVAVTTSNQASMTNKGKGKIISTSTEQMVDSTETVTTRISRGRTSLDKLAKHRVQGIRKPVRFTKLGLPVGKAASEMQSYIGLLAREKVKITYKTWRLVPNEIKELIWESVKLTYEVPPTWKKGCLSSASNKWRQYKSHLTQTFISNKLDKPDELNEPPSGYGISKEDWMAFVLTRISVDFINLSTVQKERRKKNIYPHRLSRKGYARFAEEIANDLCEDDEINRAIIWKKGRVNKQGKFEGEELNQTVDKIDEYIQQKREGKLEIVGPTSDILTKALNTEEHGGRVRAVGGHITPTLFFNVDKRWKTSKVARELMSMQHRELMEAKQLIQDQDARIKHLESIVLRKGASASEIDDKGSCSVKLIPKIDQDAEPVSDEVKPVCQEVDDVELQIVEKEVCLQGKPVILTLDSNNEIAAHGTVVELEGGNQLIHGLPMPKDCMRVSVDVAMQKSARLPFPIPDECETVGDAIGTHVAWPIHLIKLQPEKRQMKKPTRAEKTQKISSRVPKSLHMLYCYAKHGIDNGKILSIVLDHEIFQDDYELHLHIEDITALYHLEPISGNCVVIYILHLYKNLVKQNKIEKFRFVNPHSIPCFTKITGDKLVKTERLNQRASILAERLGGASLNQLVLVPSCNNFHWTLTLINPHKEIVYLLNSLGPRMRDNDWKYVVEMAIKLFNSFQGRKGRKQVQWKVIKVPRQPDAIQCGYYVMRFMKQITEEVTSIEGDAIQTIFAKAEYSQDDIDEVRSAIADCIQEYI